MSGPVRISVIIPVLNEASHVTACVESAWQAGASEVIVADGGSSDGTVELARGLHCELVCTPAGRAIQQNEAARRATGDVLLFLHADNWLDPACGRQVCEAVENAGAACGAFWQRIAAAGLGFRLLERGNALRVRCLGLPYGDQGLFLRRAVWEQVGGFPPVPLLEELLLMRAVRRIGWPRLLPGPLHVAPRRWQRHGIVRQTLRNWILLSAFGLGVPPHRLARHYPRHDRDAA